MNLILLLFFVVLSSVDWSLQSRRPESVCPPQCTSSTVNMTNEKLVGIWYEQYSIPRFFEVDMKCTFLNVSELGDYHLHYDKTEFHNDTNERRQTVGTIEYFDDGLTTFFYTELALPFDYYTVALTPDYWVMVICDECGFYEKEGAGIYAYIFTKFQYPSCQTQDDALAALERCNVTKSDLTIYNQQNCPFC